MNLFPFTAIIGLEQAKKSLIYHAIDMRLGGVLLLGHRGCAKSTLVRAFADMLSSQEVAVPFCEVPLGISEDRLLGSVDAESLVEQQKWQIKAGLLEKAHRGILYIDEVNLLPDHLADLLLDSAASGVHRIERDGITRTVESQYILVGTMNPEEGELRPQLLDRFAHGVRIHDDFSEEERMKIVQHRMAFDDDSSAFQKLCETDLATLRKKIEIARTRLKQVEICEELRRDIARRGRELHVEGMRTELAVTRTARAAAAWRDRCEVLPNDIEEAWILCLGHRQRDISPPPPSTEASRKRESQRPSSPPPPLLQNDQSVEASSPAPITSRAKSLDLRAEPSIPSLLLSTWWNQPERNLRKGSGAQDLVHGSSSGNIMWLASVLTSVRAGWLSAKSSFQICRLRTSKKRSLWIFLDASRSTGMNGFLSRSAALLKAANQMRITCRVHILVLQENRVRWLCRNQCWSSAQNALNTIRSASGGSELSEALVTLNRSIIRKRNSLPWTLLFTDGLNRRLSHESTKGSIGRMNLALNRIQATSAQLAWFYPKPAPGMDYLSKSLFAHFKRSLI